MIERKYIPEPAASIIILRKLCRKLYIEAAHLAHDFYLDENGHTAVRQALLDQIVETAIESGEVAQAQDIVAFYEHDILPDTHWKLERALTDILIDEEENTGVFMRIIRKVCA